MPRGDKGAYTDKQKRQAEHIEEGYEKRGVSKKEAESPGRCGRRSILRTSRLKTWPSLARIHR